jgi:hypothetical protein
VTWHSALTNINKVHLSGDHPSHLQKSNGHSAAPSKQRSADTSPVLLQLRLVAGAPVCNPKQQWRLRIQWH